MSAREDYLKKEKEMDAEMMKIWERPFLDGISCRDKYITAPVKLLWILKEPNGKGGGNHRVFHRDVSSYKQWKRTYGNIMRVAYGIFNGLKECKGIPPFKGRECKIDGRYLLDEIAIININKSGGKSSTPAGKMDTEYRREGVKEFLHKQIELIKPEIIINSHYVWQFFLDQIEGNEIKNEARKFAVNNKRLIIWAGHPAARIRTKDYCNPLLRTVYENR